MYRVNYGNANVGRYGTFKIYEILKGFTSFELDERTWANAYTIIDNSYERFWRELGIDDHMWGLFNQDEPLNPLFIEMVKKNLLMRIYFEEINYQTPDRFMFELSRLLRAKLPLYSKLWSKAPYEMFIQNISSSTNIQNNDRQSYKDTHTTNQGWNNQNQKTEQDQTSNQTGTNKTQTDQTSENQQVSSSTPQNDLNLNIDDIDYADNVNASETTTNTTQEGENTQDTSSNTNSKNRTYSSNASETIANDNGGERGSTSTTGNQQGRSNDVFAIYDQWVQSGYDFVDDLYIEIVKAQLLFAF